MVNERERRFVFPIDQILAGARDEIQPAGAIQFLFRHDIGRGDYVAAQRTERKRLVRLEVLDQLGEESDIAELETLGGAGRHDARVAVTERRSVRVERDALGQRAASFGEDSQLHYGVTPPYHRQLRARGR
jgi:hypothetical protein